MQKNDKDIATILGKADGKQLQSDKNPIGFVICNFLLRAVKRRQTTSKTKLRYAGTIAGYTIFMSKLTARLQEGRIKAVALTDQGERIYFSCRYSRAAGQCTITIDNHTQLDNRKLTDAVKILGPWINEMTFGAAEILVQTPGGGSRKKDPPGNTGAASAGKRARKKT